MALKHFHYEIRRLVSRLLQSCILILSGQSYHLAYASGTGNGGWVNAKLGEEKWVRGTAVATTPLTRPIYGRPNEKDGSQVKPTGA